MQIQNLLLTARETPPFLLEAVADTLLTPARVIFSGKREIVIFRNSSLHSVDELSPIYKSWEKTALKVLAFFALPFALLGALFKIVCLLDAGYRNYCYQDLSLIPRADSSLYPIYCSIQRPNLNPHRVALEDAFVSSMLAFVNVDQPLRLLSLGMDQEADGRIIKKLLLAGFQNIQIDAYKPDQYEEPSVPKLPQGVTLNWVQRMDGAKKYHGLMAMSPSVFESENAYDYMKNLMGGYNVLVPNGVVALGSHEDNALFGPSVDPRGFGSQVPLLSLKAREVAEDLKPQNNIHGAFPFFSQNQFDSILFLFFLSRHLRNNEVRIEVDLCKGVSGPDKFRDMVESFFGREVPIGNVARNEGKIEITEVNDPEVPDLTFAPASKELELREHYPHCITALHVLLHEHGDCKAVAKEANRLHFPESSPNLQN